jgi:hypothetical protein
MKTKNCEHKNSYRFHHVSPLYCEDCKNYLEYKDVNNDGNYLLAPMPK